jgi:hypothetical protein
MPLEHPKTSDVCFSIAIKCFPVSSTQWRTTEREALVSYGETISWRAWEAIGPGHVVP